MGRVADDGAAPDHLPNLSPRQYVYHEARIVKHLVDAVRLETINSDLGPAAGVDELGPVRGVGRAREEGRVCALDRAERRRRKAFGDVDLLHELARDGEVVHDRLAVRWEGASAREPREALQEDAKQDNKGGPGEGGVA
jgi:hypothetical protein